MGIWPAALSPWLRLLSARWLSEGESHSSKSLSMSLQDACPAELVVVILFLWQLFVLCKPCCISSGCLGMTKSAAPIGLRLWSNPRTIATQPGGATCMHTAYCWCLTFLLEVHTLWLQPASQPWACYISTRNSMCCPAGADQAYHRLQLPDHSSGPVQ